MKGDILRVKNVAKNFGGLRAVDNVSLTVGVNEICGLIGPNGSGKTTLFNLISGVLKASNGQIYFKEERIENLPPYKICRKGLGRTFQLIRLFPKMTAFENLIAVHSRGKFRDVSEKALYFLDYVGLEKHKHELAKNLSLGQQRMLEFVRNLMFDADLVLLDEPSASLDHDSIDKITGIIKRLQAEGKTFFIIEHNMKLAMNLCEKIVVLDHGRLICEGTPDEVRNDEKVIESYLGKKVEMSIG